MTHPIHHVASFSIVGPYTLAVTFGDRSRQVIDFHRVLRGELFGPLRDLQVFNQVRLDSEVGTLTWPNGADFDPATLHDWPTVCDAFRAKARSWGEGRGEEQATSDGPLKDGDPCVVTAGAHAGKSGTVRDINTSKTGAVTITVVQANGDRVKTLAKNVSRKSG